MAVLANLSDRELHSIVHKLGNGERKRIFCGGQEVVVNVAYIDPERIIRIS